MIRNNQTYYYHADGLGSIIAITNSAGQVVQKYEYDSFGQITYQQDANFKQLYTYTGREYDQESGLYYYRARYYDARIGRFLQQDPVRGYLRLPQTLNPYPYTINSPVNWGDPWGLYVGGAGGYVSGGISGNVSPGIFGAGSASLVWDQYGNIGIAFCGSTGIAAGGGVSGGVIITNSWGADSICDLAGFGVGAGVGGAGAVSGGGGAGPGGFVEVSSGGIATGIGGGFGGYAGYGGAGGCIVYPLNTDCKKDCNKK